MAPPPMYHQLQAHAMLCSIAEAYEPRSDLLCQYHGKPCPNSRARKVCGELHRFCHDHRMRHNSFKRAYQQRKVEKAQPNLNSTVSSHTAEVHVMMECWSDPRFELKELVIDLRDTGSNAVTLSQESCASTADTRFTDKSVQSESMEAFLQALADTESACPSYPRP